MKKLMTLLVALVAGTTLMVADVHAKRFGGGSSMGKSYSFSPSKSSSSNTNRASQGGAAANAGARTSGASRWLGPLAGLAAGGLLAAMLFGDGFEGLQILDILLLAGLVFGGIMLFKAMRAKAAPRPAGAGGAYAPPPGGMNYQSDGDLGAAGAEVGSSDEAPAWFDAAGFADGAKTHFIRLQAAWDKGDFRDIRDYTTPEMYAELQREHQKLGRENHFTEVLTLEAALNAVRREGDRVVASVHFTGLIREEEGAEAHQVSEVWHVMHDWDSPEGDWLIGGIQQVG